jgi:hypothetical protein
MHWVFVISINHFERMVGRRFQMGFDGFLPDIFILFHAVQPLPLKQRQNQFPF